MMGKSEGETPRRQTRMRQEPNPYKGMTPPSIQNLKALGLWVFFLICCSTFSLLFNVGLTLTLEYLTISTSSESPFSTLVQYPLSGNIFKHEYLTHKRSPLVLPFTHLNGTRFPKISVRKTFDTVIKLTRLPETSVRKTFDTGIKLYSSEPVAAQTIGSYTTRKIRGEKHQKDLTRMRADPKPI